MVENTDDIKKKNLKKNQIYINIYTHISIDKHLNDQHLKT